MHFISYNRENALIYAKKWARSRNSMYLNFDGMGGDCTNFASQCLYAGVGIMNYEKDIGWYYNSPNDRAAAWSGASYFIRFMLNNKNQGPFASSLSVNQLEPGDFISLNNGYEYYHTLIVTGFSQGIPLVAAHTDDSYMRSLSSYHYSSAQGIHILGANKS
ncbi:MAG: amidase domain-containing protein [Eubacterium sp.]